MVFDERPSPARVSAAAAAKLPRAVLLVLIVAYSVSGLFGRDPWQEDDAAGFGVMWTMARSGDWLLPAVAGESFTADGPLAFWAGAASITLLGPALGDIAAARLPTALWFLLATAALWYATLKLARRDEAQPVAFAFGGEATSRDYGRMLADVAVLLLLGTVGPIITLHETTSEPAAFALTCVVLYGLALSLERPLAGAALTGAVLGLLVLARGFQPAVWMALAAMPLVALTEERAVRLRAAALILLAGAAVAGAWILALLARPGEAGSAYLHDWFSSGLRGFAWPDLETLLWLPRTLPWYTWPLWPLALWALYAWRHSFRSPHIAIGAAALGAQMVGLLTTHWPSVGDLTFIIAPLVILAAFGTVSLRRAAENAIDWFTITAFCLFAFALWAYFLAAHTGFPPKMQTSVLRLTSGYLPPPDWPRLIVAAVASAFWLALVLWRVRQPSAPLWRGAALAAGGLVTLWVAFTSLFLGAVDYRRSFASVARTVAAEVARSGRPGDCVLAHHLRLSHRAVFAFHGGIRFGSAGDPDCAFALHRDVISSLLDDSLPPGQWVQLWQGHRPGRSDEVIRLYRRVGE